GTLVAIHGSAPILTLGDSQSSGAQYRLRNGSITAGTFDIYDNGAAASRLSINNAGNVGIGTTSPAQLLSIAGHCVTGDTLLKRRKKRKKKDGTYEDDFEDVRIDEIQPGDEILTLDERTGNLVWSRVNALMDMGVKPIYRLVTASGKTIRTTGEHPYLIAPDFGSARAAVFIDGANFEKSIAQINGWADYPEMARSFGQDILRFYQVRFGTKGQDGFFARLKHLGFSLITKPLKTITERGKDDEQKANFDVELAVDAVDLKDRYDIAVLFSGDSDFVYLANYLQKKGKQVVVVSPWRRTARELRLAADVYLNLKQMPFVKAIKDDTGDNQKRPRGADHDRLSPALSILSQIHPYVKGGLWKKAAAVRAGDMIATRGTGGKPIFERIIKIEKTAPEQVYDIEVEGTHNFIGNDIVAHNTYLTGGLGAGVVETTNGNITGTGRLSITSTTATSTFSTGGLTVGTSQFVVQQTAGNVGIGTTSPASLLSVQGNGYFSGTGFFGGAITGTSTLAIQSTTATSTFSTGGLTVGTSQFVVQQTSGNVGIGTTSPSARLSVTSAGTGTGRAFGVADSANTERFTILDNGNVGIGSTTPGSLLSLAGRINWNNSLGAITHLLGPTDQTFALAAGARTSGAGNSITITASNSVSESNAGGNITLQSGNGFGSNAGGSAGSINILGGSTTVNNAGAINITGGAGTAGAASGGIVTITGGAGGGVGGHVALVSGTAPIGNATGNITLTTSNSAGGGPQAGTGSGNILLTTGNNLNGGGSVGYIGLTAGSVAANNPIATGYITMTTGGYSVPTGGSVTTGAFTLTIPAGPNAPADSNHAGNGGAITLTGGAGGSTSFLSSNAGNGSSVSIIAGAGGAATGNGAGGSGGSLTLRAGAEGSGVSSNGTAGQLIFQTGGASTRMLVDGNGNVGIGTTSPYGLLTLYKAGSTAAASPQLVFSASSTVANLNNALNNWAMGTDFNDGGKFKIASSSVIGTNDRFVIDGNGNLGIGTTSPSAKFAFTGDGTGATRAFVIADSSNVERVSILNNGNLGIGTTSPGTLLALHASAPILTLGDSQSSGAQYRLRNGSVTAGTFDIYDNGAAASRLSINNAGNVGIGTTTPQRKLTITNAGANGQLLLTDTGAVANSHYGEIGFSQGAFSINTMTDALATTTRMVIDTNGNVGIGTTGPDFKLKVVGAVDQLLRVQSTSGNALIDIQSLDSGGVAALRFADTTIKWELWKDTNGFFQIRDTTAGARLLINTSGNVGIGTTSPGTLVAIHGSAPILTLGDSQSSGAQYRLRNGSITAGTFDIYDNGAAA
ncbi:MAG: NYN domain-containing protein, partial [Deltaproteobacteria bacterium]|nr:NYN domain-containing protein [Deltaproteobacteria bacterium]